MIERDMKKWLLQQRGRIEFKWKAAWRIVLPDSSPRFWCDFGRGVDWELLHVERTSLILWPGDILMRFALFFSTYFIVSSIMTSRFRGDRDIPKSLGKSRQLKDLIEPRISHTSAVRVLPLFNICTKSPVHICPLSCYKASYVHCLKKGVTAGS